MASKRFARLSNGFSKKIDCHLAAVSLYVAFYNLCRTHEALRMTPAMALGIADYSLPDAVDCLSVGFLIAKTETAIALAPNLGDLDQDRKQACGIIRIPASAIRKLTTLQR